MDETIQYRVQVSSPVVREERIRSAIEASKVKERFFEFRNRETSLPVVQLDIGLPIYRTENFRTFVDQTEYALKEGKPVNFFTSGEESESVQQLQHEILYKMASDVPESLVPVVEVLQKEKQRERLLITRLGVVVNGNRRLAAMRELYTGPNGDLSFSHVDCMVLPVDTTPDDIIDIEAALQAKPEVKLEYDWIGDGELLAKLISRGRTAAQIAARYSRQKKEIENSVKALAEADLYLKEWRKAPGQYSLVRDGEQFFNDLPGLLDGKSPGLQDASRALAWTLYDNREKLGERLYNFNLAIGKRAPDVLDRVARELDIESSPRVGDIEGTFQIDVADPTEGIADSYSAVIDLLHDSGSNTEAADALIEASRSVIESARNEKSGTAALKLVTSAHTKLVDVDLSRALPETYEKIAKQLEGISTLASRLREQLTSTSATAEKNSDSK